MNSHYWLNYHTFSMMILLTDVLIATTCSLTKGSMWAINVKIVNKMRYQYCCFVSIIINSSITSRSLNLNLIMRYRINCSCLLLLLVFLLVFWVLDRIFILFCFCLALLVVLFCKHLLIVLGCFC